MVGLCGRWLMPLAALLIATANCDNSTDPGIQVNATDSVMLNATVMPNTTGHQPKCQYTFEASETGFRFTFVSEGNYTVHLTELNKWDSIPLVLKGNHSGLNINYLKPSTNYSATVVYHGEDAKCGPTTNTTNTIETTDIKEKDCLPNICYGTNWNISLGRYIYDIPREPTDKYKYNFVIQPNYTDICTELNLSSLQFTLTKYVGLEFLNTTNIELEVPNKLPAEINWKNKAKLVCPHLNINYTCQETGKGSPNITLEKLEPYTQYNCTGVIQNNSIPTGKTINKQVEIECDLELKFQKPSITDSSITLSWNPKSTHCEGFSKHKEISYNCSCSPNGRTTNSRVKSCTVNELKPYIKYDCKVKSIFKEKTINSSEEEHRTKPGVPKTLEGLHVTFKANNALDVKCNQLHEGEWNGQKGVYIVKLTGGSTPIITKSDQCDFKFSDLSYSTSYKVEVHAFNKVLNGTVTVIITQTRYNDKALIGFLVFLILVTTVALAFVLHKIYILQRRNSHQDVSAMRLLSTNEEDQLLRVEPIAAELLLDVYKKKMADDGRLFLAEFQSIPRIFSRNSMKEAKKSHNAVKNRYVDILPYDYNRVQLTSANGETGCDYINASYINGYQEPKKYIAAQGPKDETVAAFWRMIWEQMSSIIVMVTRCEEGNRVKCAQYWPAEVQETNTFEEFVVVLHKEEQCPDYIIRRLTLSNEREHSEREVTQIQFISWPDHGVPENPQLLLKLRKRVNTFKNLFSGPIVIHCSAGVGRTGTYISIDAMMESLESEHQMDIYGYIVTLRKQRCLMVQVETQYILIHQAMIEHNEFGETEISLPEFQSTLSMLQEAGSAAETSLLQEEFQRLPKHSTTRTSNSGMTEENMKKNRSSVIPYDYNRVLVRVEEDHSNHDDNLYDDESSSSEEEDEDSMKYVNASHIEGYWGPGCLITAQGPLAHTTADFWLMVYQKRATAIVMLSGCTDGATECSPYWDQEKKAFEDIEVEVTETECTPAFTIRTMQIYHTKRKESRQVKHFHFLQWPCEKVPENSRQLTDMIRTIKHTCGYSKDPLERRGPLVVHCRDGSRQSGVFCALWSLMDSALTERMVDVFQTAKLLRRQRKGMISSQEQYHFLYQALAGAFPVQNGDVTAAIAPGAAGDKVDVVDETGPTQGEPAAGVTADHQQGAAAASEAATSTPPVDGPINEAQGEAAATNGSTVTIEV